MADKPVVSAKGKKPAEPKYEVVFNETGAMTRVPVSARPSVPVPSVPSVPVPVPAVPVPAPVPVALEEIVFDEEGEELTGEAKAKALAEAQAKIQAEELVFDEEGEEVTGNVRARIQAETQAKAKAPKEKLTKKQSKELEAFQNASDVQKMKLFYTYRAKNPRYFIYTAEGNLQILPNNPPKLPATMIPMRAFSALKPEELEEIEEAQKNAQAEIETSYVVKLKQLQEANEMIQERSDPEIVAQVVRLNQELKEMSVVRNSILYPERWARVIENPTTSEILLDQPKEERKMGYDVYLFKRNPLSRKDAEGHYREHGANNLADLEGGGTVVLFITNVDDQQTGHFHPAFEREFVFNETKYASPYQAYEVERFKEFEDDEMVEKLLGTRSAKTIKQLASQDPRQPKFPVKLWEDILEAVYSQFKEAGTKLKETGSARFHMMDKQTASPDYAVALANVRTKLKEKENDSPANVDAIKQSVITEAEQKKAKVGAIINNFRRMG